MTRFFAAIAMACVSAAVLSAQQSDKITMTGCLQPGNTSTRAVVGTSGSRTAASGSATTRGASFSLAAADGVTYRLDGDRQEFSRYLGKRVEVTGKTVSQQLRVYEVREIAGDCAR
jgi:hypothetical protein